MLKILSGPKIGKKELNVILGSCPIYFSIVRSKCRLDLDAAVSNDILGQIIKPFFPSYPAHWFETFLSFRLFFTKKQWEPNLNAFLKRFAAFKIEIL
jgi:hypothetical protein